MRPAVSVIVPAYNAAATLPDCLEAIGTALREGDELLVFDDASTDATRNIAEMAGARIAVNAGSPKGPGYGRNQAAAEARNPFLLFVDADVIIRNDTINRLVEEVERTGASAAFGSYDDHPRSRRLPALYANLRHHFVHQSGSREATTFWSGIGLIRTEVFRKFHGYDDILFSHPSIEDVELGMRLVNAGMSIRLVPEAQGTHWKDWTLWRVWHTDVVRRALPWSRLIADGQVAVPDLNLAKKERVLATLALLTPVALAGGFLLSPWWFAAAAAAFCMYVLGNGRFVRLLARRMNPVQLLGGIFMHLCYHVYASVTFVSVLAATRLQLRQPRSSGRTLEQAAGVAR